MECIPLYTTEINIYPQKQTSDTCETDKTDSFVEVAAETVRTVNI